jgi:hypothetical protein
MICTFQLILQCRRNQEGPTGHVAFMVTAGGSGGGGRVGEEIYRSLVWRYEKERLT